MIITTLSVFNCLISETKRENENQDAGPSPSKGKKTQAGCLKQGRKAEKKKEPTEGDPSRSFNRWATGRLYHFSINIQI